MCFGAPFSGYGSLEANSNHSCLVAYFEDLNPSSGGNVYYNTYYFGTEALGEANTTYRVVKNLVEDKYVLNFYPSFILKVTWEGVPPTSDHSGDEVMFS